MYELTIKTHFDAAHSLVDYPGECARLHGHSFLVEVTIQGARLNDIDIVFDFKDLKTATRVILDRFDHRHLNEIPPFNKISPTAENISRYVYDELRAQLAQNGLAKDIKITRVDVWESQTARISYFEDV